MTPPPLPHAVAPLAPAPIRDAALDTARGAAILGLIFSNMPSFASADAYRNWFQETENREGWTFTADFLIEWLIVGKCVTILSFLLGSGLALQFRKAQAAGQKFAEQTARRMAVLLGIGFLHIVFLWHGDILCSYALLGFALLLFYRIPPVGLRWLAGATATLTILLMGACSLIPSDDTDREFYAMIEKYVKIIEGVYQNGPLHSLILVRMGEAAVMQILMLFIAPFSLAIVLMGFDSVRSGWFPWKKSPWPMLLVGTLTAAGLVLAGVSAWLVTKYTTTSPYYGIGLGLSLPAALVLAAAYLYGLLRLPEGPIQRALAAVGQTALSNYLLQSLCAAIIFHFWGFGQYGRLSQGQLLGICLGITALQLAWPAWWLRHFHFGPMEYLWRRLSYASHSVPFRRKPNHANVSPDRFAE